MTTIEQVAFWISALAALWGVIATGLGLVTIIKRRDEWYQAQHEQFLQRKQRVEAELRRRHK